jgi:hypothetical protein
MNDLVIWSLLIDPRRPDTIFAGTRPAHIFRSTDAGRTWAQLGATINQTCSGLVYHRVTTLLADPADADCVWAGIELDGIRRTNDLGERWKRRDTGLSSLDIHSLAIVPGKGSGRRIIASTNNDLNVSGRIFGASPKKSTSLTCCSSATATAHPAASARSGDPATAAAVGRKRVSLARRTARSGDSPRMVPIETASTHTA